jgi:glutaredoxin
MNKKINITLYKWEGHFGPIGANIPCGECTITGDIINDVLDSDLADIDVSVESYPFFEHWWKPLMKGGWHPPIVMVNDRVISQGVALNRGVLIEKIMEQAVRHTPIENTVIFSKQGCGFCKKAKALLQKEGMDFTQKDVIQSTKNLYDLMFRIKDFIGHKTPVTLPQIWVDGQYIGGYQQLESHIKHTKTQR